MRGPPRTKAGIKAQATTELAVFAALFFVAMGAMMNIGQGIQNQMDAEVGAYMSALEKTRVMQEPVSYTFLKDRRLAGAGDSFKEPQASAFSGSSTVLWAKLAVEPDTEPRVYYKLNGGPEIDMRRDEWRLDLPGIDDDGDGYTDLEDVPREDERDNKEYTYPSVWEIETETHSGYNGSTNINENVRRRTESDAAVSTRNTTRTFKMRYYNREAGYSEDVELIAPLSQGLAPAHAGTTVARPNWNVDIANGIDDDFDGAIDEDGPNANYKEYETYRENGAGVRWERTRATNK